MPIPNLSIMIVRLDLSTFEICFQTEEKLTGIHRACKESRPITKSERPCRLRTYQSDYEIRFHPDTLIYVPHLADLASYMEHRWRSHWAVEMLATKLGTWRSRETLLTSGGVRCAT
jgi:hypothetical protein